MNATLPTPLPIVHELPTRLRLRIAAGHDPAKIHDALRTLPGVATVAIRAAARSVVVHHDGAPATRAAILDSLRSAATGIPPAIGRTPPRPDATPDAGEPPGLLSWSALLPGLAAALMPLAPREVRPWVALGLVGERMLGDVRRGGGAAGAVLDNLALGVTALTGHPFTVAASLLLGALSRNWRDLQLADVDRLLQRLLPAEEPIYRVRRGNVSLQLAPAALQPGDRVFLDDGAIVPADGIVCHSEPGGTAHPGIDAGQRLGSGTRILGTRVELQVEHLARRSRAARLRAHLEHHRRLREPTGRLTPDLDRLLALPVTAAGLMLAITNDAGRSAAMLQADPERGLALAHPLAREAALHAAARAGLLAANLESVERLARATTFVFEDIGVLTDRIWHLEEVGGPRNHPARATVLDWLSRLHAGAAPLASKAGFPDPLLAAWMAHGAVLRDGGRVLHVGGHDVLARTWGIDLLGRRPRSHQVRTLGVVSRGRLLAVVHLGCRPRAGIGAAFAALRTAGARCIAVFTEDESAEPAPWLRRLGADAILATGREAQAAWLADTAARGERLVLVHAGLHGLLPPGALGLTPVDAETGAHGILLEDPLQSLVAARDVAAQVHRRIVWQFGAAVAANAGLMLASGLRLAPPLATAALHHGFTFALLHSSAALSALDPAPPDATFSPLPPSQEPVHETQ